MSQCNRQIVTLQYYTAINIKIPVCCQTGYVSLYEALTTTKPMIIPS